MLSLKVEGSVPENGAELHSLVMQVVETFGGLLWHQSPDCAGNVSRALETSSGGVRASDTESHDGRKNP